MRWLAVLLIGLLCLALSSCPKGEDETAPPVTNNDNSESNPDNWDE